MNKWKVEDRVLKILIIFILISFNAKAKDFGCGDFYGVTYIDNYDGDTITVYIPGTHPLFGNNIPIRVLGIDSPEIKTKDKCEKEKALEAKMLVYDRLSKARQVVLKKCVRGKYFRLVCEVFADHVSIGDILLNAGLAVRYDGKTKPKPNWCSKK